jgi:hypothetical protein
MDSQRGFVVPAFAAFCLLLMELDQRIPLSHDTLICIEFAGRAFGVAKAVFRDRFETLTQNI